MIKKNTKAVAGFMILAIALTVPATLEQGSGVQVGILSEDTAPEEPHIRPEDAENLLLIEEGVVSRRLSKTPGLILEIQDSTESDGDSYKIPKRERIEGELMEQALQMEEEKARKEAEKKEAARKEAEKKTAQEKVEPDTQEKPAAEGETQDIHTVSNQFLIQIDDPDPNYHGRPLQVSDRQALEGLVMGEWGNDYLGAVLVAQCIRDSMIRSGTNSAAVIKRQYGYTAPIKRNVSNTVKQAVAFVFDEGGSGVQHPIFYFYASNLTRGKWHETQKFVVQRKAVRFFSPH
ncbi:MAG: hypothetical protein GX838_03060 [Clostridiaceae bacterium]|nr:hypothetical protein [Clostridiaceae bacterium]